MVEFTPEQKIVLEKQIEEVRKLTNDMAQTLNGNDEFHVKLIKVSLDHLIIGNRLKDVLTTANNFVTPKSTSPQ